MAAPLSNRNRKIAQDAGFQLEILEAVGRAGHKNLRSSQEEVKIMSKKDTEDHEKRQKLQLSTDHLTTGYHLNVLIARQHLSIDEIIKANRTALDSLQNVWSRQCDMAAEAFRSLSIVIDRSAETGNAIDPGISEFAERSRQEFEKSLTHTREMTDMTIAATKELITQANCQARKYTEELHQRSKSTPIKSRTSQISLFGNQLYRPK
jgi:hypothetical protein